MTNSRPPGAPRVLSKPLLLSLSRYLHPERGDALSKVSRWAEATGDPTDVAFDRLSVLSLIARAAPALVLEWGFSRQQLRGLLKERGLPVFGRKELMARRLVEADPERALAAIEGHDLYACTAEGRKLAEQFLATEAEMKRTVMKEVLEHLQRRRLREAVTTTAKYEANQVLPRGLGIDWAHQDPADDIQMLEMIFAGRPRILSAIPDDLIETLRLSAAFMHLWGLDRTPDWAVAHTELDFRLDFDTAARMFIFYANHLSALARFRAAQITRLELLGAQTESCAPCRKLKKHWRTVEAIELPYEHCTSELGCRCIMTASLQAL